MEKLLMNVLTLGIKPLYEKNTRYYKIIQEFREKLPRPQNEGKSLSKEEKEKNPLIPPSLKLVNVIDKSTHKINVNEQDIDIFYNRLRYFDYSFVLFRKYYQDHTQNLMRFNPKSEDKNFDSIMVQRLLQDDPIHPLEFKKVLIHHIKWEWKLTTYFYTWKIRKHKREMLRRTK